MTTEQALKEAIANGDTSLRDAVERETANRIREEASVARIQGRESAYWASVSPAERDVYMRIIRGIGIRR